MWIGISSWKELEFQNRWKVESFCDEKEKKSESAYDLVPLGQLFKQRKEGIMPGDYEDWTFNYLGLQNIEPTTGSIIDFNPVPGQKIRSRSKVFRENDILYGRLRPYLNKVYFSQEPLNEGICSNEFYVLVADEKLVRPKYLRAVLASDYVLQYVKGLQMGSALPRLQIDDLAKISVPLPPLSVQDKLIVYLDEYGIQREEKEREAKLLPSAIQAGFLEALESGKPPVNIDIKPFQQPVYKNPLPKKCFLKKKRGRKSI